MLKVKKAFDEAIENDDIEGAMGILKEQFLPLTEESLNEQIASKSEHLVYNEKTGKYYLTSGGKVSSVPLPAKLAEELLEAAEKGLPVDPVVKFWIRLLRNPNIKNRKDANRWASSVVEYISRTFVSPVLKEKYLKAGYSEEVATSMATVRQTPLTMEGLVNTKKVVTPLNTESMYKYILDEDGNKKRVLRDTVESDIDEDTGDISRKLQFAEQWKFQPYIMGTSGDAFFCGSDGKAGHVIRIGQEMWHDSWDKVNCDFNQAGVKGIHTGNQDYINGYEHPDNVTLNCFVDPAMIGAVACGDDVLRVKALFPHSIKDRETENKNLYHSSKYAAMKDEEWKKLCQEAVERFEAKKKELEAQLAKEQSDFEITQ